jgi:hypothetical protein
MDDDGHNRSKDRLLGQMLVAGICLVISIILLAFRAARAAC